MRTKEREHIFCTEKAGAPVGEKIQPSFQLPRHVEQNLSPAQSAEIIADYFSAVSQEYSPLNIANHKLSNLSLQ